MLRERVLHEIGIDSRVGIEPSDDIENVLLGGIGRQMSMVRSDAEGLTITMLHGDVVGRGAIVAHQNRAQTGGDAPFNKGLDPTGQIGLDPGCHEFTIEHLRSHKGDPTGPR